MITEEEAKDEVKTAPGKRWRNKWRVGVGYDGRRWGYIEAGEHFGPETYPSKEIAEAVAHEHVAKNAAAFATKGICYLGPFPVQEPSP